MSDVILDAFHRMELSHANGWMGNHPAARAEIERHIMLFPSAVLPSADDPAVIFGIVFTYGIGTIWMVTGRKFETCWRSIARLQRQYCAAVYDALGLRRMQMLVDAARPSDQRYAEFMGFNRESLTPHVGLGPQGEDLLFYTWKGEKTWVD